MTGRCEVCGSPADSFVKTSGGNLVCSCAWFEPSVSVFDKPPGCKHQRTIQTGAKPPHYAQEVCADCGTHIRFVPKPQNASARRDRNPQHREDWRIRQGGGKLRCGICGASEDGLVVAIEIHHLDRLEDDGSDELWNTIPLCHDCHVIAEALRAHRRHSVGLSARNKATA